MHIYTIIYIYIPLYCSCGCGKPTLHAPHWPGCHFGRRRIGAETWHNWFLGWLVPAARSNGIIYSKKKRFVWPNWQLMVGINTLVFECLFAACKGDKSKKFWVEIIADHQSQFMKGSSHDLLRWQRLQAAFTSEASTCKMILLILFGVDIPLFQVAKPKHPKQYDLLEFFCSKLL